MAPDATKGDTNPTSTPMQEDDAPSTASTVKGKSLQLGASAQPASASAVALVRSLSAATPEEDPWVMDEQLRQSIQKRMDEDSSTQAWGFTFPQLDSALRVVSAASKRMELIAADEELIRCGLLTLLKARRGWARCRRKINRNIQKYGRKALKERDRNAREATGIRRQRIKTEREIFSGATEAGDSTVVQTLTYLHGERIERFTSNTEEAPRHLNRSRGCYVCKTYFKQLHHFYCSLCPACGDLNWSKREKWTGIPASEEDKKSLQGKFVLVTGGRVKIGYEICLSLLRRGATVLITTRFMDNAKMRFAAEADFEEWKDRIEFFGIDFRDLRSVERFCDLLIERNQPLYALINNAAQTIWRPDECTIPMLGGGSASPFVAMLLPSGEASVAQSQTLPGTEITQSPTKPQLTTLNEGLTAAACAGLVEGEEAEASNQGGEVAALPEKLVPYYRDLPMELRDQREHNSWMQKLGDTSGREAAEAMAINTLAPFILTSRLKPLLELGAPSYVINVSAMEGIFNRTGKTTRHPHTNMAKAALNMMTRTSGRDYAQSRIYMHSVDTGWVSDERPLALQKSEAEECHFRPPLDERDGAARVLDPIYMQFTDHGKFYKDYKESHW